MAANPPTEPPAGPDPVVLGPLVAEHLVPILFALEQTALLMDADGRADEAQYYRALAASLSQAGGDVGGGAGAD